LDGVVPTEDKMKLTELDPQWLTHDMFMFKDPSGNGDWLTCKRVAMPDMEQYSAIYPAHKGKIVVQTVSEMAWKFDGNDFETMTVIPSIDASASGGWHEFIVNGEIR
jgi:hypothetical protein